MDRDGRLQTDRGIVGNVLRAELGKISIELRVDGTRTPVGPIITNGLMKVELASDPTLDRLPVTIEMGDVLVPIVRVLIGGEDDERSITVDMAALGRSVEDIVAGHELVMYQRHPGIAIVIVEEDHLMEAWTEAGKPPTGVGKRRRVDTFGGEMPEDGVRLAGAWGTSEDHSGPPDWSGFHEDGVESLQTSEVTDVDEGISPSESVEILVASLQRVAEVCETVGLALDRMATVLDGLGARCPGIGLLAVPDRSGGIAADLEVRPGAL